MKKKRKFVQIFTKQNGVDHFRGLPGLHIKFTLFQNEQLINDKTNSSHMDDF